MTTSIRSRLGKVSPVTFPSLFPVWIVAENPLGVLLQNQIRSFAVNEAVGPVSALLVNANSQNMAQFHPGGNVWIAGTDNNNIAIVDHITGQLIQQIDVANPGNVGTRNLSSPTGLALYPGAPLFTEDVMVCAVFANDSGNYELAYFTANGTFIDTIVATMPGDFNFAGGICIDSNKHIWVPDTRDTVPLHVSVVDDTGAEVFPNIIEPDCQPNCACFVPSTGEVWVGLIENGSVTRCADVYDLTGTLLAQPHPAPAGFVGVTAIAPVNGSVWLSCQDGFVRRFNATTHAYIDRFLPDTTHQRNILGITEVS